MNHRPVRDQLRRAFQISGASERGLIRRALVSPHCRQSRCTGTQVFLWLPWSDSRNSHAIDPAACGCLLPVSSRTPVTDYLQQSLQRGLSRETTSDQSESRQRQLQTRFLPLRARSAGGDSITTSGPRRSGRVESSQQGFPGSQPAFQPQDLFPRQQRTHSPS